MRLQIEHYLENIKKKRFTSKELQNYVEDALAGDYWKLGGYEALTEDVGKLVDEDVIRPISASGKNGMTPSLYNKYQLSHSGNYVDEKTKAKLLNGYHTKIQTKYYFSHADEFVKDEPFIDAIDVFLRNPDNFVLKANERSFQLFGDEKWLLTYNGGQKVLKNINVTLKDLKCEITYEPFFHFFRSVPKEQQVVNVLIVENKDTYNSFQDMFEQGNSTFYDVYFSLLVYGEGNKISRSFPFIYTLEPLKDRMLCIYYFGDLDREGIEIWHKVYKTSRFPVIPFVPLYERLFDMYRGFCKYKEDQTLRRDAVKKFVSFFPSILSSELHDFLVDGRFIPQEGLNGKILREVCR